MKTAALIAALTLLFATACSDDRPEPTATPEDDSDALRKGLSEGRWHLREQGFWDSGSIQECK